MRSNVIYKYKIQIIEYQCISMPRGAKIIHAGLDPVDEPCVWALIDPDQPAIERELFIIGTGQSGVKVDNHVGSFIMGRFMWHVFQ